MNILETEFAGPTLLTSSPAIPINWMWKSADHRLLVCISPLLPPTPFKLTVRKMAWEKPLTFPAQCSGSWHCCQQAWAIKIPPKIVHAGPVWSFTLCNFSVYLGMEWKHPHMLCMLKFCQAIPVLLIANVTKMSDYNLTKFFQFLFWNLQTSRKILNNIACSC